MFFLGHLATHTIFLVRFCFFRTHSAFPTEMTYWNMFHFGGGSHSGWPKLYDGRAVTLLQVLDVCIKAIIVLFFVSLLFVLPFIRSDYWLYASW